MLNKTLTYYSSYKTKFTVEYYVHVLVKFRKCFASFRCSVHNLLIETGRHYGLSKEERICSYCETSIEDEFHFMLICPLYNDIRCQYIWKITECYQHLIHFIH
jgi:hypothetical protein